MTEQNQNQNHPHWDHWDTLKGFSIKVKNYKCFGNKVKDEGENEAQDETQDEPQGEAQGFDKIMPINIIIGKNNSGKSTLLEIIKRATSDTLRVNAGTGKHLYHNMISKPEFIIGNKSTKETIANAPYTDILNKEHRFQIGKWCYVKYESKSENSLDQLREKPSTISNPKMKEEFIKHLVRGVKNYINGWPFCWLYSDRDIVPEPQKERAHLVDRIPDGNGRGITDLVQNIIQSSRFPRKLVEVFLLRAINDVCAPSMCFSKIICERIAENIDIDKQLWEIYLEEKDKKPIALSQTGSGFKTILLALVYIYIVPFIIKYATDEPFRSNIVIDDEEEMVFQCGDNIISNKDLLHHYVYAFEELENNMHPTLLRKLLVHLRKIAVKAGCIFFITTHSNVVIDMFSNDEHAQILHVRYVEGAATVETVEAYSGKVALLDDLGFRASDLLQANGVIWVEGPSDRLYVNKWIKLWTEGKTGEELKEGVHYQCVFSAGSLISHLTAEDPKANKENSDSSTAEDPEFSEENSDSSTAETKNSKNDPSSPINVLRVNRNAVFIMDRDKAKTEEELKTAVKRIRKEVRKERGICWITEGYEIENYIPRSVLQRAYPKKKWKPLEPRKKFSDYRAKHYKSSSWSKVDFATKICKHFGREDIDGNRDLGVRLDEVCGLIRKWNGMEEAKKQR